MWAKLDDSFYRHRKARAAGRDGRALYVASLCWAGAQHSNGHIAASDLQLIAAEAEVKATATARRLVEVGLWELVDDGWVIHDYLDWNPSADAVLAKKRARAEAGRKGGQRSRPPTKPPPEATAEPNREAIASAQPEQIGTPSPSPSLTYENPQSSSTVRAAPGDGRRERVEAAVVELARRDVQRYTATGGIIRTPGRFQASCEASRRTDDSPRLYELAHDHPDWTPIQLANGIEPDPATGARRPDWKPTDVPDELDREAGIEQARAARAALSTAVS